MAAMTGDQSLNGDFTETMEVIFQNIQYIVTVSTVSASLCIEVECKHDANCWRGEFTAKYIEDITSKTGNFKKYPVFVRMLLSALKQGSDSVFVDLLTYADLEMLKARKEKAAGGGTGSGFQRALPPNNKRYLILTYAAEFDRVHFPLPLLYEDTPDPASLKRTIAELRSELEGLQGSREEGAGVSQELRRLRAENGSLRDQLADMQRSNGSGGFGPEVQRLTAVAKEAERELRLMRREKEVLVERAEAAEAALEKERAAHRKEMRRKANTIGELETSLAEMKESAREGRSKVKMMTEELDMLRRRAKMNSTRQAYGAGGGGSRGGSRQSSRNPSPAHSRRDPHSRGPSPLTSRAHSPRGAPPSRGRPTSASSAGSRGSARPSSAGRFDPTAYVRQKKEEQRRKETERSRRTFSPAASRQSSGRSTPTRADSFDYGRPRRGSGGSRAGSCERRRSGEPGPLSRNITGARSRTPESHAYDRPWRTGSGRAAGGSGKPARGAGAARPKEMFRDDETEDRPPRGRSGRGSKSTVGASRERATSPGAALRDVKDKLSEYANTHQFEDSPSRTQIYGPESGEGGDGESRHEARGSPRGRTGADGSPRDRGGGGFEDATEEIANIDQRLHALQTFLKSARQGSGGAGKSFR